MSKAKTKSISKTVNASFVCFSFLDYFGCFSIMLGNLSFEAKIMYLYFFKLL